MFNLVVQLSLLFEMKRCSKMCGMCRLSLVRRERFEWSCYSLWHYARTSTISWSSRYCSPRMQLFDLDSFLPGTINQLEPRVWSIYWQEKNNHIKYISVNIFDWNKLTNMFDRWPWNVTCAKFGVFFVKFCNFVKENTD